ncbi:cobaltochelatase subunit CobN [Aureimonas endophytica]|uniref:Cobaltochelatase subunit CobN n=1 Tax=Aureimonas endophytica TaxID=2027858 RepID=A0A916ZWK7_9HYPH|nr:cobaltochelatase subunit CobN [Aureimonas endophytica]GGE16985.1 cobaltochelatase subunit CobN [Aureimonas endophytica]
MHLLAAQRGTIADGAEAVDLRQTPADLLVLSAADTELAALAAAARRLGPDAPDLRLANLLRLGHPMSVDTYVERTARHARLIVLRLLGGAAYWRHGAERLASLARERSIRFAALPGDDREDPELAALSTLPPAERLALWRYLTEGGAENAGHFLAACRAILDGSDWPVAARPILKAGRLSDETAKARGSRAEPFSTPAGTSDAPATGETRPTVAIVFYRALVQSGQTEAVDALATALEARGLSPLPIYVTSLKDPVSIETLRALFARTAPDLVVNLTGFAVGEPGGTVLDESGAMVLQAVLGSGTEEAWRASPRGLSPRDLAMSVALPEIDGRVFAGALAFKSAGEWDAQAEIDVVRHRPVPDRIAHVADLARAWIALRRRPAAERRVAIVLANYPNRDGRTANGVGLDTPAGTVEVLGALRAAGYAVEDLPADGNALVARLLEGPTNAGLAGRAVRETLPLADYRRIFAALPEAVRAAVTARWGAPEDDPFVLPGRGFALPLRRFGHAIVGVQPARGYNIDPKSSYHAPDLVPPHHYLAFYAFLREGFGADAVIHMGKHGNLEWLPGKALALSEDCFPEAVLGPLPHLYPFIVNDPGEGTQAKRRTAAVIVDHLTPPLTRAENHGALRDLEALVDEYYAATEGDPRRAALLRKAILDLVADSGLDRDAGLLAGDETERLERLDAYLCELKEMQIRDGLHVFGRAPEGRLLTDLLTALARMPRGFEPGEASLQRAIAADLGLGSEASMSDVVEGGDTLSTATPFDPLACDMAAPWRGPRPPVLMDVASDPWRTAGDTVERIELLAGRLVAGESEPDPAWTATRAVLAGIETRLRPAVTASGPAEIAGLLAGLDGRFVPPGPSGAPTRGRPDVLPTGRNFHSVDTRSVPTETAWTIGRTSAELLLTRHVQDHGDYPRALGLSVWGTANMRTGGDDIAQALALIGARPVWDAGSRRVSGFEIVPLAALGRPRVDVTLRVSGFFRDAFPDQIALFDRAARAIGALDEDAADNPLAARMREETALLRASGLTEREAARRAGFRVFGAKPGAYGAGLQALIDERGWETRGDLAEAYLVWGGYAYGAGGEGEADRAGFERRLEQVEAVVQNQDNREHDLLDSDDYYQFEGGMTAAVETLSGRRPSVYHNDHSRPERPVIRSLEEEIGRVVRARVTNPKWIAGTMRHGYKGAFEIAATVDYLFAFAATTGAVADHHFELVHRAFVLDETVAGFLEANNPAAFAELRARLAEAIRRGLWRPRSNSALMELGR